jgi:predicted phosphoribosyltransferase
VAEAYRLWSDVSENEVLDLLVRHRGMNG